MEERVMSRDEVRDVDRRAIEEFGLPGIVLMENAGRGCVDLLMQLGVTGRVVICAGKGNNAGDGFVIARHLEITGLTVEVLLFCDPSELKGDALVNYCVIEAAGTPIRVFGSDVNCDGLDQLFSGVQWIVDALLGTGTRGQIREPFATLIGSINRADARVLAVDLPSGMDCDTGLPQLAAGTETPEPGQLSECCVRADHTATFVARKLGFDTPAAAEFIGTVHVISIGVPLAVFSESP